MLNKFFRKLINHYGVSFHKSNYPVVLEASVDITIGIDETTIFKTIVIAYPYDMELDVVENINKLYKNTSNIMELIRGIHTVRVRYYTSDIKIRTSFNNVYGMTDTALDDVINKTKKSEKLRKLLSFRKFKNRIMCSACVVNLGTVTFLTYGRRHDVAAQTGYDLAEMVKPPQRSVLPGFVTKYNDRYLYHSRTEAAPIAYKNLQYFHKAKYEKGEQLISETLYYDGSI